MSATRWIAYVAISFVALAAVFYLYRRREPPGRGRTLLALLRGGAIALLFLLLFDPRLKQPIDRAAARRAPVLLDGSLSMLMPSSAQKNGQWKDAAAQATKLAGANHVVVFGDVPISISADSLGRTTPNGIHSRLLPALQAAAEGGASSVTVISDRNLEDADAVGRWIPRLGVHVNWVTPKDLAYDLALTELDAPAWAEAGKPVDISIGVQSNGRGNRSDSASVTLHQDGVLLATQRFAVPASGRVTSMRIAVKPRAPAGGGYVRIEATIDAKDGFQDDDVRNAYVYVSDEPAGIVLVSLAPDWEPRFILPVLERAVALPSRGYLRGANGMWMRVGAGLEAGARVNDAAVQKAVANADLLVVHNAKGDAPAWLIEALRKSRRLLVLPTEGSSGLPLPTRIGNPVPDDWFVAGEVPASPVSPLLSGLKVDDIPPIESMTPAEAVPGAWAPLFATRGRRGVASPIAIAAESDGRRWAIALGAGYWRWAFQGGAAGDIYNRLWSSLAGWIMRDAQSADVAAVRPVQRAVFRGEPIRWVTRAGAMDSVRVQLMGGANGVNRTVVADHDTAILGGVAPGTYRFNATSYTHGTTVSSAGELTVESYSPEFARMNSAIADQGAAKGEATALHSRSGDTRPLHAMWLPYALLLMLLATEWILRRRWGLR